MTTARTTAPKVETIPIDRLTPDPENARIHGRDNLKAIKASLERFGQVRPLLATSELVILAGNGTLDAMKSLGWTEAQVLVLPWGDRDTCRAYAIADNRTAELAAWDNDLVDEQLGDLAAADVDMGVFGFDAADIGAALDQGDRDAGAAQAEQSYRCPACGFRWRYDDGGEVVPL